MYIKSSLLIVLFIFISCKESAKESTKETKSPIKSVIEVSKSENNKLKGFCTQMPFYKLRDVSSYANFVQNVDSLRNDKSKFLSLQEYKTWNNSEKGNLWKSNTISEPLSIEKGDEVLSNFYKIEGAIIHDLMWIGNNVRVKFIDGEPHIQELVMRYAREWENWCSVRFDFVNTGKADITITFQYKDEDVAYWSYIGRDSKKNNPSMSLTGIQGEDITNFRGTVLHEFGHALGLIHEQSSPEFPYQWDEEVVYKYYKDVHEWTREQTFENVIFKYNFGQYNHEDATRFDENSIMLYYIPKGFLKNNSEIEFHKNNDLSDLDKELINRKY